MLKKLYRFFTKTEKVVAIGCFSHMLPYVIAALKQLKKHYPEKLVILGGIGPTEVAEDIIREFPFIDFVIKGCGIEPLPRLAGALLRGGRDFSDISGLVYRNGRHIMSNPVTPASKEAFLNAIAFFHLVPGALRATQYDILTARGCIYKCTFCQIPVLGGGRIEYKDICKVAGELKLLLRARKNKRFHFSVIDEAFVVNRKRVQAFCMLLRRNRLVMPWSCYGRIDRMDEKLMRTLSDNGCERIFYGFESGSDRILKKVNKGFCVADAIRAILLSKKYFKKVIASFVCMYPFETKKDFLKTLACMAFLESKGIEVALHPLAPIKDSLLFRRYGKHLSLTSGIESTFHSRINRMPQECTQLIRRYPHIFYLYYFYKVKDVTNLTRLLAFGMKMNHGRRYVVKYGL
ncbi:MAG: radical SAM protein [Candidatus Omnitrophica bacterium]|nr:radical SAM protein [Candidatus Omnitrophota bacterium]